jgi:hypothetical protein
MGQDSDADTKDDDDPIKYSHSRQPLCHSIPAEELENLVIDKNLSVEVVSPQEVMALKDNWGTILLLCAFGFFKEIKPSEPYLTQYLIGEGRGRHILPAIRDITNLLNLH